MGQSTLAVTFEVVEQATGIVGEMNLKKWPRNGFKNHFMLETGIQWILVEHRVVH